MSQNSFLFLLKKDMIIHKLSEIQDMGGIRYGIMDGTFKNCR